MCIFVVQVHSPSKVVVLWDPNESLKQVETLPFPCFSFPLSLSVKYYPMTFHWLASIKAMDFLFLNQSQVTVQE